MTTHCQLPPGSGSRSLCIVFRPSAERCLRHRVDPLHARDYRALFAKFRRVLYGLARGLEVCGAWITACVEVLHSTLAQRDSQAIV